MNRREFLKKSLEGIIISIPFISGCGKNPVDSKYELEGVYIDKELVSDGIGNYDGVASKTELDEIYNYFKSNLEAWSLGIFPGDYQDKNEIPHSVIINTLFAPIFDGPYKSEDELRKHYEGNAIKTINVGIYVFIRDGIPEQWRYRITHFYKAPGANVSGGEWTPKIIINS